MDGCRRIRNKASTNEREWQVRSNVQVTACTLASADSEKNRLRLQFAPPMQQPVEVPAAHVPVLFWFPSAPYGSPKRVASLLDAGLCVRQVRLLLADSIGLSFHAQTLYGPDDLVLNDNQLLSELQDVREGGRACVEITVCTNVSRVPATSEPSTTMLPILHAIRPTQGSTHGGTRVELISQNALLSVGQSTPVCRFGLQFVPVIVEGESLYVIAPAHAPGPCSVEISIDGLRWSQPPVDFLYIPPNTLLDHGLAVRARTPASPCYIAAMSTHTNGWCATRGAATSDWRPDNDPGSGGCV